MSQADNLAALGSNVNASGVLQPASGGTGTTTSTGTGSVVLSSGATLTNATINGAVASGFTMKNRIINGDMVIDQRNAGASVTPANGAYTLDRWGANQFSSAGKFSVQQNAGSVTPPAGFTNYLGVTSLSAYSIGSNDIYAMYQPIEGYNIADLAWGTANAKTITLSFWVRSSLTGTFGGSLQNNAGDTSYPYTYTISSANTWEYKTVTIAGPTTGTWLTTNGIGILLRFGLGAGSTRSATAGSWQAGNFNSATGAVSVVGTNGATFYVTGVQLEQGSAATSFEWLPYGTELSLCYRYYQQLNFNGDIGANGMGLVATKYSATDSAIANAQLLAPMRTTPTITKSQTTARFVSSGGVANVTSVVSGTYGINGPIWVVGTNNGLAAGSNGWFDSIGSIYISAEL